MFRTISSLGVRRMSVKSCMKSVNSTVSTHKDNICQISPLLSQHRCQGTRQMRAGDWSCSSCSAHNFANRSSCFQCKSPKGDSVTEENTGDNGFKNNNMQGRPGDWKCPSCNANNFANRTSCFRCEMAKPDNLPDQPVVENNSFRRPMQGRPGDWSCSSCNANNFANRTSCFKCQSPKGDSVTEENTGDNGFKNNNMQVRPGDWKCPSCNANNFANRTSCFKCQSPKSNPDQSISTGGFEDDDDDTPFINPVGNPTPTLNNPNARPGDWICKSCQNNNFANRSACFRCRTPKDPSDTSIVQPEMKRGDWSCPQCNSHNYARNTSCFGCKQPKSSMMGHEGESADFSQNQGSFNKFQHRDGDWPCPSCNFVNFASRSVCNKCGTSPNHSYGGSI